MDLDKYIGENIDDILDNPDEYVFVSKTNNKINKKKVKFELETNNKIAKKKDFLVENLNSQNDSSEYWEQIYGDIYEEESFDDFGFVLKKNYSDSDEENYLNSDEEDYNENKYNNKVINVNEQVAEHNEEDYTEDIVGELFQNMFENNQNKVNFIELFKNISQSDLTKLNEQGEDKIVQSYVDSNEKIKKNSTNNYKDENLNEDEFINDDGYYFINLINTFMKYYNNKFDKIENFFSGIKDENKDTSSQMEIFFDAIVEYKSVKESFKLNDDECMKLIYLDSDSASDSECNLEQEKIIELFSKWEKQIYMLDLGNSRYISPSLLVCLNYINENNINGNYWNIYNLRNV